MIFGISKILPPELIKILMEMGHGDEIVLADANFPAQSNAKRIVRCDGHGMLSILEAVLELIPLDTFVKSPVVLMEVVKGHDIKPNIWKDYRNTVSNYLPDVTLDFMERYDFYERAKKAYAIVQTGEMALYGNIILKKGIIEK